MRFQLKHICQLASCILRITIRIPVSLSAPPVSSSWAEHSVQSPFSGKSLAVVHEICSTWEDLKSAHTNVLSHHHVACLLQNVVHITAHLTQATTSVQVLCLLHWQALPCTHMHSHPPPIALTCTHIHSHAPPLHTHALSSGSENERKKVMHVCSFLDRCFTFFPSFWLIQEILSLVLDFISLNTNTLPSSMTAPRAFYICNLMSTFLPNLTYIAT